MSKRLFGVVAGPRLGGKTTIAGTLPGKTVLLQAAVLESGSRSAVALAKRLGNDLEVRSFTDLQHLRSEVEKVAASNADNIFIDGFSAINDMRWSSSEIQAAYKKNQWEGYNKHGQDMKALLEWIKMFTYEPNGKHIWMTAALKVKTEGGTTDVELEAKGKMAVTEITKLGEAVVTVMLVPGETGMKRILLTKQYENWPGRIDGVLDDANPGVIEPNLGHVLQLLESQQ